jgi:hypothetical protein
MHLDVTLFVVFAGCILLCYTMCMSDSHVVGK